MLIALLLVTSGLLADAALSMGALSPETRAADTDLTLVTDARYDVQPAQRRVRVTVDATATNRKQDTVTKRYYFDRAFLAVQAGTRSFAAIEPSGVRVSVAREDRASTLLRIDFGRRIYGGKSLRLRFRFDLPDPGGAANRPIRIGDALVAFPVWAFASDGARGSAVSVAFPAGYDIAVERGSLPQRTTGSDGRVVLRSGTLAQPTRFFAYVVADRPGAYVDTPVDATVDGVRAALTVRAWVDDPAWAKRVSQLFRDGLPIIGAAIGRPWAWDRPLIVAEGADRAQDADAGLFDPSAGRIEIAYYADPFVVLHEAAHSWFNGRLLADRWANEAFASYYAERALTKLELDGSVDRLTDELVTARIPLNAWATTAETAPEVERYGYAASLELARKVGERAGDEVLRAVFRDADAGVLAYLPPTTAGERAASVEMADGAPDWRGLLDLLEEHAGKPFDDLWREWVVRPDEAALLDARRTARASYERTLKLADGWAIPRAARDALRAWQFDTAERILADTRTVIAQREALEQAAARSGLELPDTVRRAFEHDGSLVDASAEALRELELIDTLESVRRTAPLGDDPITSLGLVGASPEESLAAARAAFSEGRFDEASAAAAAAHAGWDGAWEEGRRRLIVAVALLATTIVLASTAFGWLRRRRVDAASSVTSG